MEAWFPNSFGGASVQSAMHWFERTYMLAIQPGGFCGAEKELRSVGIWSSVGHTENSWPCVLQLEVFILKLVAVNRFTCENQTV
jgi:hypothetical protein